jgi:hypothetical protein
MSKKVWLVEYKDDDPWAGHRSVYLKKEDAYESVTSSIAGWAADELKELEGQDNPDDWEEQIEILKTVLKELEEGKKEDAYSSWREYADDAEPGQDLLVEELDLIE